MFLPSRAIGRGDLRSAGISCFIAKPLRSYRSPSLAPASFGRLLLCRSTILGYSPVDQGYLTKNLWVLSDARLVTPSSLSARCCLRPRGAGQCLSLTHIPFCLRLLSRDRHFPKIQYSRGYGSDSEHTLFTSLDLCTSSNNQKSYTTGRLTEPYPGGPMLSHSLSTMNQRQVQTIIILEFEYSEQDDQLIYKSILKIVRRF